MKHRHLASTLFACAGGLLTVSGVLMAVCASLACGGVLWAAASCLFLTAYHFRLAENNQKETEEPDNEQKTV